MTAATTTNTGTAGVTGISLARVRRRTELSLIVMAVVITGAAYTLASLGKNAEIPPIIVPFLGVVLGLLVVAHIANRALAKGADGTLLPIAALLHGLGFVMIARLNEDLAGPQATWTVIGIGMYVATLLVVQRATDLARYQWSFLAVGAGLLVAPLVPGLGTDLGTNAQLWISLGPVTVQPGEFAKIALALFFAGYLADRGDLIATDTTRLGPIRIPNPRDAVPVLLAAGFAVLVMFGQKDLGSALLFFTLFVIMLWMATEKISYLWVGLVLFSIAAYIAWVRFDVVQVRVRTWLNPWPEYEGKGYQIIQSMFAMANGGVDGTGLGLGNPKKIPAAQNDFIFAAIGEELGLLGTSAIIIAFLLIIGVGLRTAMRTERRYEKLLATGLTAILGVQAFIIIGGVTRVIPLTGITLPFVSYGGSSLFSNYILLALLVRVGDSAARRSGDIPDDPTLRERRAAWRARRASRRVRKHAEAGA
jgi:cell division protein FtsW (lipid II flippase)